MEVLTLKTPTTQIIIFLYCIVSILATDETEIFSVTSLIIILSSVTFSSVSYILLKRNFTVITAGIYGIISFVFTGFLSMSPLFLYNVAYFTGMPAYIVFIIFISSLVFHYPAASPLFCLMTVLGIMLAYYIQYIQSRYDILLSQAHKIRDDSTEKNILLKLRNQSLLEKQDYEIYNATLKERNRIAREIHDNVGHLLSRSILLTGVVKTVNKDENCTETLDTLHDTLNQAMTSIRESVHNLHDDSVDLKETVSNLVNNFGYCQTNLTYDMGTDIPRDIKFSFISILKEGLNNIYKHSNATCVTIVLREHPAMYQLIIDDNGNTAKGMDVIKNTMAADGNKGIGITNISTRVKMLGGSLQIHTQDGFRIFVTVPKKDF